MLVTVNVKNVSQNRLVSTIDTHSGIMYPFVMF